MRWGGTRTPPPRGGGVPRSGYPPGGTEVRVPPLGGVPRSGYPPGGYRGPGTTTPQGGYRGPGTPPRGGTEVWVPPGGYRGPGTPPPRGGTEVRVPPPPPPGGGTRVGQQKQYSLHSGRYASCVHAGGLSCEKYN